MTAVIIAGQSGTMTITRMYERHFLNWDDINCQVFGTHRVIITRVTDEWIEFEPFVPIGSPLAYLSRVRPANAQFTP